MTSQKCHAYKKKIQWTCPFFLYICFIPFQTSPRNWEWERATDGWFVKNNEIEEEYPISKLLGEARYCRFMGERYERCCWLVQR